jgi:uncharacterized membrane protein (UPF0127 family)
MIIVPAARPMTARSNRRLKGPTALLAAGLTLGLFAACHGGQRDRFVKIYLPGGRAVTAELAVTDSERARGLMFREKLLADQGMLFVFGEDDFHSFWMKNTLIALDLIWLDAARRIVHIEADVPPCREEPCPTYGPKIPARFVLELKSGSAAALGIKLYDQLQFVLPEGVLRPGR